MHRKSSNRSNKDQSAAGFQQQARRKPSGLASELFHFILHSKKWWLTPIIMVILLLGVRYRSCSLHIHTFLNLGAASSSSLPTTHCLLGPIFESRIEANCAHPCNWAEFPTPVAGW